MIKAAFKELADFFSFREINDAVREHELSWGLGILGASLTLFSFPILLLSVLVLCVGKVTIEPVSAAAEFQASAYGFLINRWFWAALFREASWLR